ncbi:MAG: hypothetical protein IJ189_02800, partial [Clostridia bacterium]|nr:hypothetical protein [Clostridia bacterium]
MIKKDPCACWLAFDTNFSGAGVWWSFGIRFVTGYFCLSGIFWDRRIFCFLSPAPWSGITIGIIFSSIVIPLLVHPSETVQEGFDFRFSFGGQFSIVHWGFIFCYWRRSRDRDLFH